MKLRQIRERTIHPILRGRVWIGVETQLQIFIARLRFPDRGIGKKEAVSRRETQLIPCRSHENFIQVMLLSMNAIADIETLYARLGERDYQAVMSYLADDIVWIVADNSPLADRSPYHGIAEVRSGIFERLTAGFDKLVFDADEIFECNGGERVVALGYYYFRFHGQAEERKAQVAHVWTIRDGRAVKFQQYLDTLQVARDAGALTDK